MNDRTFANELRLSPINVARAALQCARGIAYPSLDVGLYMNRLDALAEDVQARLRPAQSVAEQADVVSAVLFERHGFRGNDSDYFDPRNSFLNDVLDRRLGIPLSLSLIYIYVARQAGLSAHGINMPGHFIVAVRNDDHDCLLDPFHGGRMLTEADCIDLVRRTSGIQAPFQKEWLLPAPPQDTLARMLNNLRMIYVQSEAWRSALAVVEHLHVLQPAASEHVRDLGLLHYQLGELRPAADYLETYLERDPEAPEADTIRQNVWRTFDRWARSN
ncbi:MAG: transglutaminase family protein [Anaerolineales bacterium]|nr:transglutaminase family protein [Anaerolineales bacterium]